MRLASSTSARGTSRTPTGLAVLLSAAMTACGASGEHVDPEAALRSLESATTTEEKIAALRELRRAGPAALPAIAAVQEVIASDEGAKGGPLQVAAFEVLAEIGPAALPALAESAGEAREDSFRWMERVFPNLGPELVRLLEARAATWAWVHALHLCGPRATEPLERLALTGPPDLATSAVGTLGRRGDRESLLRVACEGGHPTAFDVLAEVGVRRREDLERLAAHGWSWDVACRSGEVGVSYVLDGVTSSDVETAKRALEAVRRLGPAASTGLSKVIGALDRPDLEACALEAIGAIGKEALPARDAVRARLGSTTPRVRVEAVWALGRIGAREDVPQIASALGSDPVAVVRARAARALGITGRREAADPLARALADDPIAEVRAAAATALSSIGPIAAGRSDAIVGGLDDPAWIVRDEAVAALALVVGGETVGGFERVALPHGGNARQSPLPRVLPPGTREAVLPAFERMLRQPENDVEKGQARAWLASFGPPGSRLLRECMDDPSAHRQLRRLRRVLDVTDPELSAEITSRLGEEPRR